MKQRLLMTATAMLCAAALLLTACDSGDSGNTSSLLMLILSQGRTYVVSHFAGTDGGAGYVDAASEEARFDNPVGVAVDGEHCYITDFNNHVIRKIAIATDVVTTFAGAAGEIGSADGTGSAARFSQPFGITSDGINLYVADSGNHTIRKIVIATGVVSTFAGMVNRSGTTDATGTAAQFFSPHCLALEGGYLYVADTFNHTIRRILISTGAVTTFAGTAGASGSTDDTGTDASFNYPHGITSDGDNLYVADSSNHTIRKIVITSRMVSTFAGTPLESGTTDDTGTAARFNYPLDITFNETANALFVTDGYNHTIRRISLAGVVETPFGEAGVYYGMIDGLRTSARFYQPTGITNNGNNLYVADSRNNAIRKISLTGMVWGFVSTIAGKSSESDSTDSAGTNARFYTPVGITGDGANFYVSDAANHTIRKVVIADGAVTTLAGLARTEGSDDGTGTAARFSMPKGLTRVGDSLYVCDYRNHTIRKIVIATGATSTFAGKAGEPDNTDGIGDTARFRCPFDITSDGTYFYVTDCGNYTIRRITIQTRQVETIAGKAGENGSDDGAGSDARFHLPMGITHDKNSLYVADHNNFTVRKIAIATGMVTTIAGQAGEHSVVDGTGAAARFDGPMGIARCGNDLFVTDNSGQAIRKITISTRRVTTIAGKANKWGCADGNGATARFDMPAGIFYDSGTKALYVTEQENNCIRKIQ